MNGNKPAMPVPMVGEPGNFYTVTETGLTKRELFAAMFMQHLLADRYPDMDHYACLAVSFADALIRQLAEPPK